MSKTEYDGPKCPHCGSAAGTWADAAHAKHDSDLAMDHGSECVNCGRDVRDMSNEKHSPTPWWRDDDGCIASGSNDTYITVAEVLKSVDADFIKCACNSHDALVEALKETIAALDVCCVTLSKEAVTSVEIITGKAQAALKLAKEGK